MCGDTTSTRQLLGLSGHRQRLTQNVDASLSWGREITSNDVARAGNTETFCPQKLSHQKGGNPNAQSRNSRANMETMENFILLFPEVPRVGACALGSSTRSLEWLRNLDIKVTGSASKLLGTKAT